MRRIACICFPYWPIQRMVVDEPALRRQRLVLFENDSRRGQIVYAASPLAMQCGVCAGMPLAEARSLTRSSWHRLPACDREKNTGWKPMPRKEPPRTIIRQSEPATDREQMQELALAMHRFSPLVGLEQTEHPQALLLDTTGLTHLFDGEDGWCESVNEWLQTSRYHAHIAIADTIGTAWAIANASRFGCPQPNNTLEDLPIESLRVSSSLCDTLAELGIHQISQLRKLPRASLAARFGDELARRMDQADGLVAETIRAVQPPDSFTATRPLEYPLTDRRTLTLLVQELVSQTARNLLTRQQGALRWRVTLQRYQSESVTLEISLFQPAARADHLRQLIEMHIEQLRNFSTVQHPVTSITVTALECIRLVDEQPELFAAQDDRSDTAALGVLVNRLSARLGSGNVVRPQILAEAQPELAMRHHPLTGSRVPARQPRRSHTSSIPRPLERPLRLLSKPQPISVQTNSDGSPNRLTTLTKRCQALTKRCQEPFLENPVNKAAKTVPDTFLVRGWGPERIETGWWRAPLVRREYWRVETVTGQRLWIFHDLKQQQWFLHGVF